MCIYWQMLILVNITIYNVGFCVARSDRNGNAKALKSGTSNSIGSHTFFVYRP